MTEATDNIDMRMIARRLITPNDTLDVRLFDYRGQMYPDVRRQLLSNAAYIIDKTVAGIDGLMVSDIFLNGSSAGYFYQKDSDIDVRIEVHNENCPYLSTDNEKLSTFFMMLLRSETGNMKFMFENRSVDFSIKAFENEMIGLYSILQDKWIRKPDKHITDGITFDVVWQKYVKRYNNIVAFLRHIQTTNRLKTAKGLRELEQYYRDCFVYSEQGIQELIVHKLLSYQGILQDIRTLVSESWQNFLSLTDSSPLDNEAPI